MQYIFFNNKYIPANNKGFTLNNRAFKYGDGIFESMRMVDGKIPLLPYHCLRLLDGLKALSIETNLPLNTKFIGATAYNLAKKNSLPLLNARIKLTVFRAGEGYYSPQTNNCELLIEATELPNACFTLNNTGLSIGVYTSNFKPANMPLSNFKTTNCLLFVLASIYQQQNNLNQCLLVNQFGRIAEATTSNIFVVANNKIITPALNEGGVNGVMKQYLIAFLQQQGFQVHQSYLKIEDLKSANEIWLTNAVQGIQWVKNFENNFYSNTLACEISHKINQQLFSNQH